MFNTQETNMKFTLWYSEGYGTSRYVCGTFDSLTDAQTYINCFSWSRSHFTIEESI